MSDDPTGQEPTSTPTDPAPTGTAPPWERDGTPFDADRAWSLIEGLRTDLAKAKATPPPAAQPAPAAAPDPSGEVAELRAELLRERLARRHGLDDDLAALLGSGTEAEISARAELLAARLAGATPTAPPVARRPVAALHAGADPTAPPEETDPAKLAGQVRRSRF
ncbi:hypothetical protein [Longispora fulva]|uniref:Pyruvate/2-oxoglutarate dehydrogenase complex dihydrolipoamide acyltransferase (E2) component n=1 Tax=Longispora fulva TaxID=619741 RepID=A0A8J7GJQ4_9ACTN|nr:hypothetical protein [Longispora fulva]MBG6140679.1 pyruvate/2-oxoglutarate dehydrogenase complex dihydrolipoamide acyltransferase (E2) component [Longispora fulva]